ncbi:hypothetical protein AJ80_07251 [Polytolypa hystricis UAMH7299]|uniref:Uncharacterized protein n=1 Tax=Polytolypa hystricis (strain UAMH7299) TaxID=1447883 RepID=A0A2B7XQB0_POLH7|nr:hypothetical protein AJ80_07251 [Polytolypa hystricis UAMH7299]
MALIEFNAVIQSVKAGGKRHTLETQKEHIQYAVSKGQTVWTNIKPWLTKRMRRGHRDRKSLQSTKKCNCSSQESVVANLPIQANGDACNDLPRSEPMNRHAGNPTRDDPDKRSLSFRASLDMSDVFAYHHWLERNKIDQTDAAAHR